MKKLLLIIIAFMCVNVYAKDECTSSQIERGMQDLKNVTYSLEYNSDKMNINGDFQEGYFTIKLQNMPEGYMLVIPVKDGRYTLTNKFKNVSINGGIYTFNYYSTACNSLIKSYEVRVPFYKQYCTLEDTCDKDVWFDGTYSNLASNLIVSEPKISVSLIIILIILILIIIFSIFIFIKKRRRKNEVDF